MNMNNVVLIGRLTADPELKYSQSGMAICRFTLAVDRFGKDKATDFIYCTAFSKTAENLPQYRGKGDQVGVSGSLQTESYTDKDGQRRTSWGVICNRIEFIGKSSKQAEAAAPVQPANQSANSDWESLGDGNYEDMPF